MTKNELSARLDAFEAALAAYGVSKFSAKEIWDLRAGIVEDFRTVEFADPGARKDAWQRLQDGMDMLSQKGALLQVENEAFATEAEERIEALQRKVDEAGPDKEWTKEELAALRAGANDIFDFMRQNRWPTRERRTAVWDRFTASRDRVKKLEDARYEQIRAGIRAREERSAALLLSFRAALEAARPATPIADLAAALVALRNVFTERSLPFAGLDGLEGPLADGSAEKAPLKVKSDSLRELRRLFGEQRTQFTREDGQETYNLLTAVQKEMDAAWGAYKEARQKRKDEWSEKQKAFAQLLEEKKQKRLADAANLEKVVEAKRAFGPRLEARLASQQDYLNKLYDDLDELETRLAGARNFDMRGRVEASIEGKKTRIAEIETDIKEIGGRIETNVKDIAEIESKVAKIRAGVSEMDEKIAEVQARKPRR
ncbi:hypothetical protein EPD60_01710 [Flaviaesturariibacter flavus]|uniref:Uncharacterized protein n=1 Tax=Flaviaesturariibacter flavus TaxID=2502780 RepID=A0A4R1BPA7_9BACT|nr:hypothetical protein [Flaviaesturariibacter flavus]TCJ19157.1 hypothetical protein EPD60_01710 [Flaviaesturariibacter flavus]